MLEKCDKIHSIYLKPAPTAAPAAGAGAAPAAGAVPAAGSGTTSTTSGTNILLMASIKNVPILKFDFDGNLDNTLKFQIDTDASVYGACTGQGTTHRPRSEL